MSGNMNSLGSNDDCYFYFYSSCTKGDDCPFRHCEAALGTETVCSLWREGRCIRDNCKFRHMESRINRGFIPCYWEDQPSGCLKPHCVFYHRKPRANVIANAGNEGLILPVSTNSPQTSPSTKMIEAKDTVKSMPIESYSNAMDDSDDCPASIPIEPIVFSFDNEESDSESASSTPMKSIPNDSKNDNEDCVLAKKNLTSALSNRNNDFGIKTLEQIKMERIHKESDNFYKSAYDAPLIDPIQIKMKTDSFKAEIYPPKAEFISVPTRPIDSPISATTDSKDQSTENERNLRNRLLKRKNVSVYSEKSVPPKKVITFKKAKDNDSLDFKIKTLDEIRKEKMNKLEKEETTLESNSLSPKNDIEESSAVERSTLIKKESPNVNGRPFRKFRLKRPSNETPPNSSSILQEADSSSDCQKKERNQMILHEVQNISEDQNKADSKALIVKRKDSPSNCTDEKSPKQQKMNKSSPSKNSLVAGESEEKQVKSSRPVIKRKRSTNLFQPSVSPSKEITSTVENLTESIVPEQSNKTITEVNTLSKDGDSDKFVLDKEKSTPKTSVDDIDSFLLNEANVSLDYEPDPSLKESDDILLEIEQLLES